MARGNKKSSQGGSAGQNRKKSDEFLQNNRTKNNIHETETGLQYEILKEGEGSEPREDDTVVVHQRAMLLGGKILDDTYKDNTPMEFNLSETIEGYTEGLCMMKPGSRYKFYVSYDLAWGKRGSGGRIGPYAVVIFDVALIEVK